MVTFITGGCSFNTYQALKPSGYEVLKCEGDTYRLIKVEKKGGVK